MSIVVGTLHKNGAIIGADTMTIHGDIKRQMIKTFTSRGIICGIVGTAVFHSIMKSVIEDFEEDGPISICDMNATLRATLANLDWPAQQDNGCSPFRILGIVITDGITMYEVDGSLHFQEIEVGGYASIGSGYEVAFGAEYAMRKYDPDPRDVIESMLEASCHYVTSCGMPLDILEVGRTTEQIVP